MKRILYLILALALVLSLAACTESEEEYISGISFDPADYDSGSYARYENKLYGIIIEYPENFERVGNFDIDGYITFERDGVAVSVYMPDTENNDVLTAEEYVLDVLELTQEQGSGITKYGKCSGYKALSYDGEGSITVDFVVKGVDAFYRFAYTAPQADFTEEDYVFQSVMSSIRIDDGVYNKLTRMSSRYTVLLEYATSMQYITDANYANHCLNNFEMSKEERHRTDALNTSAAIRKEMEALIAHERKADEGYDDMWAEIIAEAERVIAACKKAEACVANGDYEGAQAIARTGFTYDLAEKSEDFLATINAEISEY